MRPLRAGSSVTGRKSSGSVDGGYFDFLVFLIHRWDLTPFRITVIYLLFGFSALYFSDVWLVQVLSEPVLSQVQALKGGVEVVVTGGLIYGLVRVKESQVTQSQTRLNRQREELHVLHRVLRHNLRNDLNVILGLSEKAHQISASAELRETCTKMASTAEKMVRYTEQAERIRQVSEQNGDLRKVDLASRLPPLIRSHADLTSDVEVSIDIPDAAVVRVNQMFLDAISELISNGIKHNDGSPEIGISVDREAGPPHKLEVAVEDNGPGIAADVLAVLESDESDQRKHLSGMGLWFVVWVVEESGGAIQFDTDGQSGTTVRLHVPKAPETWLHPD